MSCDLSPQRLAPTLGIADGRSQPALSELNACSDLWPELEVVRSASGAVLASRFGRRRTEFPWH